MLAPFPTRRGLIGGVLASVAQLAGAKADPMQGFDQFAFQGKKVFHIGKGPPVLFLHELPGLIPEAIQFARRLSADCQFSVFLPLLFGSAGDRGKLRGSLFTPCWGKQFDCTSKTSLGGIVPWVAGLLGEVDGRNGNLGVAVIGNCLTGSVPIALMADAQSQSRLKCCIAAQPALPFGRGAASATAIGLTDAELQRAADSKIPLLAMRLAGDPVVPEARLLALAKRFDGKDFEYFPICPDEHCHEEQRKEIGHRHASLTIAYCDEASSGGRKAYLKVAGFLRANLARKSN